MALDDEQMKAFKAALKDTDGKSIIDEIVEKAKEGLISKRDELLSQLKEEKESKAKLSKRVDAIEEAKAKAEEDAINKSGDVEKITANLKEKHASEMKAKNEELAGLGGKLNTHIVGKGLTEALVKANVTPALIGAAKALIETEFTGEVGDNDGTPFAKFDGKSVDQFVTDWASSETGKNFVSAKSNSGGSSNGANGQGNANGGKTMPKSEFDQLSPVGKRDFSVAGGKLTDD